MLTLKFQKTLKQSNSKELWDSKSSRTLKFQNTLLSSKKRILPFRCDSEKAVKAKLPTDYWTVGKGIRGFYMNTHSLTYISTTILLNTRTRRDISKTGPELVVVEAR